MADKTKAQAIMELACAVAGEDVSPRYGKTTTDALDALADALAGSDMRKQETVSRGLALLGERVSEVVGGIGSLKAALAESGVDLEGKALSDVVAAAVGRIGEGSGPPEGWAEDADLDGLFEGDLAGEPDPDIDGMFN